VFQPAGPSPGIGHAGCIMNMHAERGMSILRRPRAAAAGLVLTLVVFIYMASVSQQEDENTVWIWMGIRSDGRCGRDFGTEHLAETKCGRGNPCCSAHGWCGNSEEYCSPTLGCQSGCWGPDHPREIELTSKGGGYNREYDDMLDDYNESEYYDDNWEDWEDYHGYGGHHPDYDDDWHDEMDLHEPGGYRGYDVYDEFVPSRDARESAYGEAFHDQDLDGDLEPARDLDEGVRDPGHAWTADELVFDEHQAEVDT